MKLLRVHWSLQELEGPEGSKENAPCVVKRYIMFLNIYVQVVTSHKAEEGL